MAAGHLGQRLVVLQAEELPRLEVAGGGGRAHDHLDDGRRQAIDADDRRAPLVVEARRERLPGRVARRLGGGVEPGDLVGEQRLDVRRAVLGRGHRAHHRPRVHRVVVAVVADRVPVAEVAGEEADAAAGVFQREGAVRAAHGLEALEGLGAVIDLERAGALALVGDVGRGAGGDEQAARRERHLLARPLELALDQIEPLELHRLQRAALVGDAGERRQLLDEADPLLEELGDLLVVEAIGRAVGHVAPVDQRDAAPLLDQRREVRHLAGRDRARPLGPHRAPVLEELARDLALLVVVGQLQRRGRLVPQRLPALEELLDLDRVVGGRLGGGVDAGQPAADHQRRQPDLQAGERVALERPRQLQRHQEVGRLAHAADQVVLDVDDRRLAGARRDPDVIEPHRERLVGVDRAAEADAAVDAEGRATRQVQMQRGEEALVPADGDAVLGDAAEARQPSLVERGRQLVPALDGARRPDVGAYQISRQRLDLEPVDPHHAEPGVEQVLRQRRARRPHADHQHVLADVRPRHRARAVERIPARQEAIDLVAPAHAEHVGEDARLGLRDVDRLLLLEDAGLHAVVADAMAGAGHHRVVDDHHRQRGDRVAVAPQDVHLADLLVERAAAQRDADGVLLHRPLLVVHPLRAGVLLPLVAVHAVVGLGGHLAARHAPVGEAEPVAPPPVLGRPFGDVRQLRLPGAAAGRDLRSRSRARGGRRPSRRPPWPRRGRTGAPPPSARADRSPAARRPAFSLARSASITAASVSSSSPSTTRSGNVAQSSATAVRSSAGSSVGSLSSG